MKTTMDKQRIIEQFQGCIHCSQIVLSQWAEELGYDRDEAARMAAPFGGGLFNGDTCGAVSGAMIAIGMRYGHCEPGDAAGNEAMIAKVKEFLDKFNEKHGSHICRKLLGYDIGVPGEFDKALETGTVFDRCPNYVNSALEILDEIM